MKRIYILLILNLILLSGCTNKEENLKKEYISMKNQALKEANYINENKANEELPVDIITEIERVNEEEVNYKAIITNPKENMHDVKVLVVHNYHNEDVFPTIGVFDDTKELLVETNNDNKGIVLEDTIKTTKNISKLNLELKMRIEYTDDNGEKKDIYYKTT